MNYQQVEADIVVAMLPLIYRETPERGHIASNRDSQSVSRAVDIAKRAVEQLKGGTK